MEALSSFAPLVCHFWRSAIYCIGNIGRVDLMEDDVGNLKEWREGKLFEMYYIRQNLFLKKVIKEIRLWWNRIIPTDSCVSVLLMFICSIMVIIHQTMSGIMCDVMMLCDPCPNSGFWMLRYCSQIYIADGSFTSLLVSVLWVSNILSSLSFW